ncbi:MAG: diacylglycerol/lipid kinase family protein [Breznakia sp.]
MQYIFIINPHAGKKDQSQQLQQKIYKTFQKNEAIIVKTEYEKHATKLAHDYALKFSELIFVVCGGDGTLKEVLEGVYKFPHVRLAIFPIGTGNDFIRYFKTHTIADFLDLKKLKHGYEYKSDILTCGDQVCLNIASVGLDAMVVERVSYCKRIPLISGSLAYYLALFFCFLSSIAFKQTLIIDNKIKIPMTSYVFVVVANGSYYGGGFHPTPMANMQDGVLNVLTISSLSRFNIIKLMNKYKTGEHLSYDFVKCYECETIQILGDDKVVLNMDGETTKLKNPILSIKKKAITLILPAKE